MRASSRVGPNPWLELEYFASSHNCYNYLLDITTSKNYIAMCATTITERNEAKKEGVNVEEFDIIKFNDPKLKNIAEDMSCSFLQAKDYYTAAESISDRVRPVLLYYGMISLARLLMLATYTYPNLKGKSHGMAIDRGTYEKAQIRLKGFFPRFVACYINRSAGYGGIRLGYSEISDDNYYTENNEPYHFRSYKRIIAHIKMEHFFSLDELLHSIREIRDAWEEVYPTDIDRMARLNDYGLDEMSSHFIAMFILSMVARYKPTVWGNILEGHLRGDAFVIKRFLDCSFYRFPLLISNELKIRKEM